MTFCCGVKHALPKDNILYNYLVHFQCSGSERNVQTSVNMFKNVQTSVNNTPKSRVDITHITYYRDIKHSVESAYVSISITQFTYGAKQSVTLPSTSKLQSVF